MKYHKKTLQDIKLDRKTVVVRLDLNVPLVKGEITDATRIEESLPTLNYLIDRKCKIVVLSHLSRIKSLEDILSQKKSLAPVAAKLKEMLKAPVIFCPQNIGPSVTAAVRNLPEGSVLVLENTRYQDVDANGQTVKLESKNNADLAKF